MTRSRWPKQKEGNSTIVTNLTWETIKRRRDSVNVKLVLKGILAFEDAKLAADACDPARRDQKRHAAA
jgi:isopentenyl diphosphate isomerase/L-lactate dehydrogenase-like FMN-dependent dehydrogenase